MQVKFVVRAVDGINHATIWWFTLDVTQGSTAAAHHIRRLKTHRFINYLLWFVFACGVRACVPLKYGHSFLASVLFSVQGTSGRRQVSACCPDSIYLAPFFAAFRSPSCVSAPSSSPRTAICSTSLDAIIPFIDAMAALASSPSVSVSF
jgi:hypothetical protein